MSRLKRLVVPKRVTSVVSQIHLRKIRTFKVLTVGALVLLTSACGAFQPDPVVALRVEPDTVRLPLGTTFALQAEFIHESGSVSEAGKVVWISLRPSIAVVDTAGLVEAIGPGRTMIVAAAEGLTDDAIVNVPGWFSTPPLPAPRRRGHAVSLGGKLYYIGGNAGLWDLEYVATNFVYDPESERWNTATAMPTARDDGAFAVADGSVYVIGGINPEVPHNGLSRLSYNEVYRAAAGVWETLAPMLTSRGTARADTLRGRIYVVGGNTGAELLHTVEIYDPTSDVWTLAPAMPTRRQAFALATFGDAIYVAGGEDGNRTASSVLEIFDVGQGTWRTGPSMPSSRAFVASAVLQNQLVVLGGWSDRSSLKPLDSVEVFDPLSETWLVWPSMPVPRREARAAVLAGILYVMGGTAEDGMTSRVDGFIP